MNDLAQLDAGMLVYDALYSMGSGWAGRNAQLACKGTEMNKPSLGEITRTFGKIGLLSFGGPAGQIALMHRVLVDEKKWMEERQFLHALNFCMLLPGPEAMQLATYSGWLMHGVRGGLVAGLLFVVPGALVLLALSAAYVFLGDQGWMAGLLFGLKAAVLALVLEALLRVSKRALKDRFAYGLAGRPSSPLRFSNCRFRW
jgi:chromate transporter